MPGTLIRQIGTVIILRYYSDVVSVAMVEHTVDPVELRMTGRIVLSQSCSIKFSLNATLLNNASESAKNTASKELVRRQG